MSARIKLSALAVLLTVAVVGGGSSQESGMGPFVASLLALPAIAWASHLLLRQGVSMPGWLWLALAVVLLAIPAVQLMHVPTGMATVAGREELAADLAAFGAEAPSRWSLAPAATGAALFALLAPLGIFLLCMALPATLRPWVAGLVVLLALASLVLGIVQLGAPQESVLNPFPQWQPAMGGFFANPNHQATLLVVAAVFATSHAMGALQAARQQPPARAGVTLGAVFMLPLSLVALPLTGSRAGVIILVLACAAVVALQWPAVRWAVTGRVLLGLAVVALAGSAWAAARWMQVDAVDELRAPMREATAAIASRFAPLGSGVGSYVPVFEQAAPPRFLMGNYINHAHNEYLQWWLEAGAAALLAMGLAVAALGASALRIWRLPRHARGPGIAALVSLLAIGAHSFVDYPLRTPAMLAVAAVLAGMAAGQKRTHVPSWGHESGHTRASTGGRSVDISPPPAPAAQG
ncbi:MAG TPA: O-antigen ligase family protein [Luteimonas sp.]|nr:O-antigen ligase family protein [Luteimonas sp.]